MIVTYSAKRKLKAGINSGDIVVMDFPTETFDPQTVDDTSSNTSISGAPQYTHHSIIERKVVKSTKDTVNTKEDYRQFLYSVMGGVPFLMTDYDDDDNPINVAMEGAFTRDAKQRFNAGEFNYTFTVREI